MIASDAGDRLNIKTIMKQQAFITVGSKGIEGNLPVALFEENGDAGRKTWIARCAVLGISSQGDTKAEAEEAVKEAIDMFIEDIFARGTIDRVLVDELGWQRNESATDGPDRVTGFFQPSPVETRDLPIHITA